MFKHIWHCLLLAGILTFSPLRTNARVVYSGPGEFRARDLTLDPSARGEDVVDACIGKLSLLSHVFGNDFGFLKRIALVESNFGRNQTALDSNPGGGIWQITPAKQQFVLNNENVAVISRKIGSVLGFSIADITDGNFSIPLRSAFMARLFIHLESGDSPLPGTLALQADWWRNRYNSNGDVAAFIEKVTVYENENSCNATSMDIWFMIDGSGSVGRENFNISKNFVIQVSSELPISPDLVRTGLMVFDRSTHIISRLDQDTTNQAFADAVAMAIRGRGTNTGNALTEVLEVGFNVTAGARPTSLGIPRVLIVLTDGKSDDDIVIPTERVKAAGVTVFAVGVGRKFNRQQINFLASDPDSQYAYTFTSFTDLTNVLRQRLLVQACALPAVIQNNTATPVNLIPGQATYVSVHLRRPGPVNLTFTSNSSESAETAYLSTSVVHPNSALYDVAIDLPMGTNTYMLNVTNDVTTAQNVTQLNIAIITTANEPRKIDVRASGEGVSDVTPPDLPIDQETSTLLESTTVPATTTRTATTTKASTTKASIASSEPVPTTNQLTDHANISTSSLYVADSTNSTFANVNNRKEALIKNQTAQPQTTFAPARPNLVNSPTDNYVYVYTAVVFVVLMAVVVGLFAFGVIPCGGGPEVRNRFLYLKLYT